jgi:hypothetical protein
MKLNLINPQNPFNLDSFLFHFLCLVSSVLIISSCKHEIIFPKDYGYQGSPYVVNNPAPTPTPPGHPCNPDTVYFNQQILSLITSNCTMKNCHNTNNGEVFNLTNYTAIMRIVVPGNPNASQLYTSITVGGEDPMPPSGPLSSDQIALIAKWISQGAKNLTCDYCDTSKYTFSGTIFPLIQNYCIGCHSGSNVSGNVVSLENYNPVKAQADNGQLIGTITHTCCKPMPQNGPMLSDCIITQFKNWIKHGAKDN